jgi:hypothetical protein
MQAFDLATAAHPVVGRLNSADSLSRLPSSHHWDAAEQRVAVVVTSFASQLNDDLRAEADTIRGKVAARRGDVSGARKIWEGVVARYPQHADARLQLSRWKAGSRPAKASAGVPAPKRSLFSWILGK